MDIAEQIFLLLKETYEEGYCSMETYNDMEESDLEKCWERRKDRLYQELIKILDSNKI